MSWKEYRKQQKRDQLLTDIAFIVFTLLFIGVIAVIYLQIHGVSLLPTYKSVMDFLHIVP